MESIYLLYYLCNTILHLILLNYLCLVLQNMKFVTWCIDRCVCAGRVKRKNLKKSQQGGGGDEDED